jgi:hypothetical protein
MDYVMKEPYYQIPKVVFITITALMVNGEESDARGAISLIGAPLTAETRRSFAILNVFRNQLQLNQVKLRDHALLLFVRLLPRIRSNNLIMCQLL